MKIKNVVEFERIMKDPENIDPPFQPNATQKTRKMRFSKKDLKSFLLKVEMKQQQK